MSTNTKLAEALAAMLLAGCMPEPPKKTSDYDQCLRAELFQACIKSVPAGPQAAKYNDWSEVVEECGNQASYQSVRPVTQIKKECRADE